MKAFLTDKVVQSEKNQQTNLKDIAIMRDMLKLEKNVNIKKDQVIREKDAQLKQLRDESLELQQEHLIKINELTLKIEELQK